MIVVDANIWIYALIESEKTDYTRKLQEKDAHWVTTDLCLHEIVNVVCTYQRLEILSTNQSLILLQTAIDLIRPIAHEISLFEVLKWATRFNISGYDAHYVALAYSLNVPLISEDKKLKKAVPPIVMSMADFLVP